MQNILKSALKGFVFCLTVALFSTQALAANFQNLSFMGLYNERHPTTTQVYMPFLEQVKKDLNGEVTFNYFANSVLYPISECYSVFDDGRVEFGVINPTFFPGVMNLITVIDIPNMAPNAIVGSLLINDVVA